MIDIVVVNYRTPGLLERFLNSLRNHPPQEETSVTVVDIMPSTPAKFQRVTHQFVLPENIGYNRACNWAAKLGGGDVIGFFNADTAFVNRTCVDRCVEVLRSNPRVGVVGPLQVNERGFVTHAGIYGSHTDRQEEGWRSPNPGLFTRDKTAVSVSGSAYFIKRSVWSELSECPKMKEIGQEVDGAFLPTDHYFGETWCSFHAQQHGYEVRYLGSARMLHTWHASSKVGGYPEQRYGDDERLFNASCEAYEKVTP